MAPADPLRYLLSEVDTTRALVVTTIPAPEPRGADLYVQIDGQEQPVQLLHPDDQTYALRDATSVLRQHPDAYLRLRVKPDEVWQPPAKKVRESLEGFLARRWPGLYPPSEGGRLTAWGWVAFVSSALNAVGLLFFPLVDGSILATLHSLGGQPTALSRTLAARWFSPLLAVLTAACLVQALRDSGRRRLWITASYVPAAAGFAAALGVFYSAYLSFLNSFQ